MVTARCKYTNCFKLDNENIHGLDDLNRKLDAAMHYFAVDVPVVIGVEAVKHFKKNFETEGVPDVDKWASRKTLRAGGTNSQKVLSKSGELSESIDYKLEGDTVIIYSDKPYAQIHNEGGEITVTPQMRKYFWAMYYTAREGKETQLMEQWKAMALAKKIKVEKRQFIGESPVLIQNITDKIVRDLTKILNGV